MIRLLCIALLAIAPLSMTMAAETPSDTYRKAYQGLLKIWEGEQKIHEGVIRAQEKIVDGLRDAYRKTPSKFTDARRRIVQEINAAEQELNQSKRKYERRRKEALEEIRAAARKAEQAHRDAIAAGRQIDEEIKRATQKIENDIRRGVQNATAQIEAERGRSARSPQADQGATSAHRSTNPATRAATNPERPTQASDQDMLALRRRSWEMIEALRDNQMERALAMTNPALLIGENRQKMENLYKVMGGLLRLARIDETRWRFDRAEFDANGLNAKVHTSHRVGRGERAQWKPQKPSVWIQVDEEWLLTGGDNPTPKAEGFGQREIPSERR